MDKMIEHESSYKYGSNGQRPDKYVTCKLSGGIAIPDKAPTLDEHDAHYNKLSHDIVTTSTTKPNHKKENEKHPSKIGKRGSSMQPSYCATTTFHLFIFLLFLIM